MDLTGKSALVTGAGRGLGRAIAAALAEAGSAVTILSRTRSELEEVAAFIKRSGGRCHVFQGDVSDAETIRRCVQEISEQFGSVDILVNNAAVIGPPRFLEDADPSAWRRTIDTNLNGAYLCAHAVIPFMIDSGGGKIINIASGLGRMAFPRFCAYAVSKAGIIQLTRSLAEEFGDRHIQVNAIDPGVMDTRMQEELRAMEPSVLSEEIHRNFTRYKEEGELRDPREVAELALFLASPSADHLTGRFGSLSDYRRMGMP